MKAFGIFLVLFGVACVAALLLIRIPEPSSFSVQTEQSMFPLVASEQPDPAIQPAKNATVAVEVETNDAPEPEPVQKPVQSLEERGDAMLFEIDALQGTPFDKEITQPFDER